MRQVAHIDFRVPMLLPGMHITTSPTEFYPIKTLQLERFDGTLRPVRRPDHRVRIRSTERMVMNKAPLRPVTDEEVERSAGRRDLPAGLFSADWVTSLRRPPPPPWPTPANSPPAAAAPITRLLRRTRSVVRPRHVP